MLRSPRNGFRLYPSVLGLLALFGATARAQEGGNPREDVTAREEYFWHQRTYPSSAKPHDAMLRARESVISGRFPAFSQLGAADASWRSIGPTAVIDSDNGYFSSGPQIDAGRVTAIAPVGGGGTIFLGTADGGVWKSTDRGFFWLPLTDNQCSLTTGAVTVDPVNPNIVYVGTGEYNTQTRGCGVLRSINGGTSWSQAQQPPFKVTDGGYMPFSRILVDPASAGSTTNSVVYASGVFGIFRSTDSGTNWTKVLSGSTSSMAVHPTKPATLFAGNMDFSSSRQRGVYRSTDGGVNWSALPPFPTLTNSEIRRIEVANSPSAPDLLYAIVAKSDRTLAGLFVWDDAKGSWTKLAANGVLTPNPRANFGDQGEYNLAVAVDPRNSKRVYIAGVRAYRSTDSGASFVEMGEEIHCDWHAIVFDPLNPDVMYAGTDGGVFVSTDVGASWTSRNSGLSITQFYGGISATRDGSKIAGGSQDNGTHVYNGSSVWNSLLGGDGGYTAIDYNNPSVMYAESQFGNLVRFSPTGRKQIKPPLLATEKVGFVAPFVMDPIDPKTLYFGSNRIWRTKDEGTTWTPLTLDLSIGEGGTITTIAVSNDGGTVYAGTSNGLVWYSQNGGANFSVSVIGLPNRSITRIAIDPANAAHALVTVSGFGSGHVFETTSAGLFNWVNISGNLVDAPANSAAFVPGLGIMVATDVGVFLTTNGGVTWTNGPPGMPPTNVSDLIYLPAVKRVVAATYGRGMFVYSVGGETAVLRGDVNADGKVDAFDALLIQQGIIGSLPDGTLLYPRGDANCNSQIDVADALLVLRSAVGLPTGSACVKTVR